MDQALKSVAKIIFFLALVAHILLITLFFAPTSFLVSLRYDHLNSISISDIPDSVKFFLNENEGLLLKTSVTDSGLFKKLISGILEIRSKHFMEKDEKLAFKLTTLDFGGGVLGMQAASEYYFKKPLTKISEAEWKMLINLHTIFLNH